MIKKHPSGNDYIRAGDVWVRDFTKKNLVPLQISNLYSKSDYKLMTKNEEFNRGYPKISEEPIKFKKVLIVSDGYKFEQKQKLIQKLPKDICILAVNKALSKWNIFDKTENSRSINAYVVNNPYTEANSFLSKNQKYFPTCIASIRTSYDFLKSYKGNIYTYCPVPDGNFGEMYKEKYLIDDYRNPICAAVRLAYEFDANKIMLFCCDDSFEDKRETSVKMNNNLYTYPHHLRSQEIIDAGLHWILSQKDKEIEIADYSQGQEYKNATYISSEEDLISFFNDKQEEVTT